MKTYLNKMFNGFSVTLSSTVLVATLVASPALIEGALNNAGLEADLSASVYAQDKKKKRVTRRLPGIGSTVSKSLTRVSELFSPDTEKDPDAQPQFKKALAELKKLEARCSKCNSFEKANMYRMFGAVAYSLEDVNGAINYHKKVIAQSPGLPIGTELQSMFYIAQLSYSEEKYKQAIDYFDRRVKLATESNYDLTAKDWHFKSLVCYQAGDSKCALNNISKAIKLVETAETGDGIAQESWYNLQRSIYLSQDKYAKSTEILEVMIKHYPKKSYWSQLGSMYGLLEREKDQLHALDTTYIMKGLKNEKAYVNLAYLFINSDVPYRAATILESGMKDGIVTKNKDTLSLLATSWQKAQHQKKALAVLEQLGQISKDGSAFGEMARVYLNLNQPKDAVDSALKSLKKGKFEKKNIEGEVLINLGIAYFELGQFTKAIEAFDKASKSEKHAKFARNWSRYSESQRKRYIGLKDSLAAVGLDIEEVIK